MEQTINKCFELDIFSTLLLNKLFLYLGSLIFVNKNDKSIIFLALFIFASEFKMFFINSIISLLKFMNWLHNNNCFIWDS